MARQSYRAIEVFDITGRGVVAVFDEHIALTGGKPVSVQVTTPDGASFHAVAYVERLLWRAQPVAETSALLIEAISRHAISPHPVPWPTKREPVHRLKHM